MAAQTFPTTIPPHVGSSQNVQFRLLESEYGDGYMSSAGDGLNPETVELPLTWDEEDIDDINTMKTFLRDHKSGIPFLFTPQGETQQLYRCKAFSFQWSGPDSGTFTATFQRWYGSTP